MPSSTNFPVPALALIVAFAPLAPLAAQQPRSPQNVRPGPQGLTVYRPQNGAEMYEGTLTPDGPR